MHIYANFLRLLARLPVKFADVVYASFFHILVDLKWAAAYWGQNMRTMKANQQPDDLFSFG